MSGENSSTDYESHRASQNIIKTVSNLLSEIIQENKEEFKNQKETGKKNFKKINTKQSSIQKNHPQ